MHLLHIYHTILSFLDPTTLGTPRILPQTSFLPLQVVRGRKRRGSEKRGEMGKGEGGWKEEMDVEERRKIRYKCNENMRKKLLEWEWEGRGRRRKQRERGRI
jgi:hypothetical protein